jgi:hypothetical protein
MEEVKGSNPFRSTNTQQLSGFAQRNASRLTLHFFHLVE